jgi:hypothetical protein
LRFDKARPLKAAQQFLNLRANPICIGEGQLYPGRLRWQYLTSPSPLSRLYSVRIEFIQGKTPEVFVDDPDLNLLAGDQPLPHVYDHRPPRLCLYLPRTTEWQPWMRLDQTIVPWIALWLFYFEEWLSSGDWKGGGRHPNPTPATRRGSRRSRAT